MDETMEQPGAPIRPRDLRAWLESRIAEGHFRPGDRIDEQELCRKFGVSRTPVREALLQLASLGLVMFRPRQGAEVARLSIRQIAAMWEVLANLEGLCAALSARRMTPPEIEALAAAHRRSTDPDTAGSVTAYAEANTAFHEALYAGCRNEYLAVHVKNIRSRLNAYRRYPFQRSGGIERSIAGHEAVLQAVRAGNEQAADAAMREHVAGAVSFLDMIAELPDILAEPTRLESETSAGQLG